MGKHLRTAAPLHNLKKGVKENCARAVTERRGEDGRVEGEGGEEGGGGCKCGPVTSGWRGA